MRKYILLSFTVLMSGAMFAQPANQPKPEVSLAFAQQQFEEKNYIVALENYEKAFELLEADSLLYPIAQIKMLTRDYKGAERTLRRILRKYEDQYPDAKLMYGQMLKMNEKYDEARQELQDFIVETFDPELKKVAQLELLGVELAQELPPNARVTVEHGGKNLNNKQGQYSPTLMDENTLYYAGFDTDDIIALDQTSSDYHAMIYKSTKSDRGWGKPEALGQKINRENFHTANVYITPSGNRMFFTRALLNNNVLSETRFYRSAKGEDGWKGAEELPGAVNGSYIVKHPVVGELFGNEVLFFSSNMEGGFGGFDVYYSTLQGDGTYGEPVNLGEKINTEFDEVTPFYKEGTLYFSSKGYPSLGGFDLFFSIWDGTTWSAPENMGKGFNSSVDDMFLTIDEGGYNGFLVSNRDGTRSAGGSNTCCNDIFTFELAKINLDIVAGTFTVDKAPLKGAKVTLADITPNEEGNPFGKTNKDGNVFSYDLAADRMYKLVATHPEYFPDSVEVSTIDIKQSKSFEHRFFLKKMPPPEPELDTISIEEPIELSNIYYDFDDTKILKDAEKDLELIFELLTDYPDMKIELRSHTDARGNAAYNETLSQGRAESARRWLVRKGISRSRIEATGYGKRIPKVVSERNAYEFPFLNEGDTLTEAYIAALDTIEFVEEAHRLNRRTEFKITEGPTTITVKRARLRKNIQSQSSGGPNVIEPTPDRNRRRGPNPPQITPQQSIKPHRLSSLYGKKDLKGVPIMHFKERTIDFGEVKQGEKREYVYEFTNLGDTPLQIDYPSHCDCTEVEYPRSEIQPGESGKIKVIFDSAKKDESETIDVDFFLKQKDPAYDIEIFETIQYKYDLIVK